MSFPKGLIKKFRVHEVLIDDGFFYRANVFDLSLNKMVLLTILCDFDYVLYNTHKNKFESEMKNGKYEFLLNVYEIDYLKTDNAFYYTQELGKSLLNFDPKSIVNENSIRNWFYELALPSFYNFLNMSKEKNISHGFISPNTIYYSDGKIKIGDYILGVLIDINPQIIIDSLLYNDSFFSTELSGSDLDAYSFLKILQFVDCNDFSRVFKAVSSFNGRTDFVESVKKFVDIVYANQDSISEKYLFEMKPLLERFGLYKKETVLYKPEQMPLLYDMISSWDLKKLSNIVVIHINHYLNDILELNNVFASICEKLVYIVVPYSMGTKILPSTSYPTYYHEIENNEYVIKKDGSTITVTTDFYAAMYESIKLAFKKDVIPLINKSNKIIIIEDGGFHYSVVDELINTYPVLRTAIIGSIEQTTSGVKRYKDLINSINVPYPVLSVARSKIKMRLESHFIARRVIDELNYLLYTANNFLSFHSVLIIGYGIIGRNISCALSALKCDVAVYDIDETILLLAKNDGLNVIKNVQNIKFTDNLIIIGATGESAFTSLMFFSFVKGSAKKIYLASASSKRIEFQSIVNFFEAGDKDEMYKQVIDEMENIRIEQKEYGIIYSFQYKNIEKKIILIANGYPVNFYRKNIISLTESVIELIYCEIFLLIKHLLKESLKPDLYLLGASALRLLDVEEERLVRSWFNLLALQFDETDEAIWNRFDVHPYEDVLRDKCFIINEKETGK
jgi:S-adenosylhomocysteine hydrolase